MEEIKKTDQSIINMMVEKLFNDLKEKGSIMGNDNKIVDLTIDSSLYNYYKKVGKWLSNNKIIDGNPNPLLPLYVYGAVGVGKSSIFEKNAKNKESITDGFLVHHSLDEIKTTKEFDLILKLFHTNLQAEVAERTLFCKQLDVNDGYKIAVLVLDDFGFENDNFNDYGQLYNKMEYVTKKLHSYYEDRFFHLYKLKIIPKIVLISTKSAKYISGKLENIDKRLPSRFNQIIQPENCIEVLNNMDFRLI